VSANYTLADKRGGDTIRVTGTGLANLVYVRLDGASVAFSAISSTQFDWVMPTKSAGSYDLLAETIAGTTPDPLVITAHNPSDLSTPTGWWGVYGGVPWASQVIGSTHDLVEETAGQNPDVGTAINSKTSAAFLGDATTKRLKFSATLDLDALIGAHPAIRETGWMLVRVDSVGADPGAGLRNTAMILWGNTGGVWGLTAFSDGSGGVVVCHHAFDGSTNTEVTVNIGAVGSWAYVSWGYDGSVLWVRKGDDARVTSAYASNGGQPATDVRTQLLGGGVGYSAPYLDGRILEHGVYNAAVSDADIDKNRRYLECRFPSLGSLA
jgi:hypothetical protein